MRILIQLLSLLICPFAAAQVPQWTILAEQPAPYFPLEKSIIDDQGNTITIGWFYDAIDFDPGPGEQWLSSLDASDSYIWKVSSSGDFVWVNQIGGLGDQSVRDIDVDAAGNVYITGYFDFTVDFDPGPGVTSLTAEGSTYDGDIFTAKYASNGDLLWAQRAGTEYYETGLGICVDGAGNVYVTGTFEQGNPDFDSGESTAYVQEYGNLVNLFIQKLNTDGGFLWVKNFESEGSDLSQMVGEVLETDASDNVYLLGYCTNATVDFDPGPGEALYPVFGIQPSIFVVKFNSAGDYEWARTLDYAAWLYNDSFRVNDNGDVFIAGYFEDGMDFDPGIGELIIPLYSEEDIFISRWNTLGELVWVKALGGPLKERANSLTWDSAGNILVSGYYHGTLDFDPGNGVNEMTVEDTLFGCFLLKLDSGGQFLRADSYGGITGDCISRSINIDQDQNLIMSGWIMGDVDFDIAPDTDLTLSSLDVYSGFIIKMAPCQSLNAPASISGPTNACPGTTAVFSVPDGAGAEGFEWNLPAGWLGSSDSSSVEVFIGNSSGFVQAVAYDDCGYSPVTSVAVAVTVINGDINFGGNTLISAQPGAEYQWVDCNNNNDPISGATNQSFSPASNGSYAVLITKDGCTLMSDCLTVTSIATEELEEDSGVFIYPVPAVLNMFVRSTSPISTLCLTDMSGKCMQRVENIRQQDAQLNISALPSGIYSLLIVDVNRRAFTRTFNKMD